MLKDLYYKDYLRECDAGRASRVLFDFLIEPNKWNEKQFNLYYFTIGFFSSSRDNRIKIVKGVDRYCQVNQIENKYSDYLNQLIEVSLLNKELFLDILYNINNKQKIIGFDIEIFTYEVLKEDKTFIENPSKVYAGILKEFFK